MQRTLGLLSFVTGHSFCLEDVKDLAIEGLFFIFLHDVITMMMIMIYYGGL